MNPHDPFLVTAKEKFRFEQQFNAAFLRGDESTANELIRFVDARSVFVWEEPIFFDDEPIDPKQLLDEIAVALFGGRAPGRGVRLPQITGFGQIDHRVPHRSRADTQLELLHQRLRPDGLAGLNKLVDHERQDHFLTVG